jgi:hypothetical protein
MQIRYLETLTNMSKQPGTKVIFMPGGASGSNMTKAYVMEHLD